MLNEELLNKLVKQHIPWFDDGDSPLSWETRINGDVGTETPGEVDLKASYAFADAVAKEMPGVSVTHNGCGEWVIVDVVY